MRLDKSPNYKTSFSGSQAQRNGAHPHGHIKEKEIRQSPGLTDWHVNFYFFGREIVYFVFLFPLSSSLGFEPTLQKIERFDGKGPKRRGEIKTLL